MVSSIETVLNGKVGFRFISDDEIRTSMSAGNASEYSIETLLKMFKHYNEDDFCGSPFIVSAILKRMPTTFDEFLNRELK